METKQCCACKKTKPLTLEFFYKQAKNKDGFRYDCKKCKKTLDKKWRSGNSDYIKKYQKSPEFVFSSLKYQAKKRNMPFELTLDYYLNNLAHKLCFYCGTKTKYWVDRRLNSHTIGYTRANSVSCCELCNKMKSSNNPEIFINHCKKVAEYNSIK